MEAKDACIQNSECGSQSRLLRSAVFLENSAEQLLQNESILEMLPAAVVRLDRQARVGHANRALARLYRVPIERTSGLPASVALGCKPLRREFEEWFDRIIRCPVDPTPLFAVHYRLNGERLQIRADWVYLATSSEIVGIRAVIQECEGSCLSCASCAGDPNKAECAKGRIKQSVPPLSSLVTRESLSNRETEVLSLMLKGHESSGIARNLCVSIHTIRNHVKSLYRKFEVHSREELLSEIFRGHRARGQIGSRY